MKGETHALVGAATAVMVTNPVTFSGLVLAAITGALGGLYCDIDSAKSIGWDRYSGIYFCGLCDRKLHA